MFEYLFRKLIMIIPMALFISIIVYVGLEIMPGDPTTFIADPNDLRAADNVEELKEALGLNEPLPIRYFNWLKGMVKGDFGYSMISGAPINNLIKARLPASMELGMAALFISTFLGLILGLIGALHQNSPGDRTLTVAGMLGISIPTFFIGLLCILLFSLKLGWLPIGGRLVYGSKGLLDRLPNLIMPSVVMGLALTAGLMRYARACMLDSLSKNYIVTAKSKGLPEWRVNLLHGFRTSLMPVLLLLCFRLPMLVGGAVIIEKIFSWPGLGSIFLAAVSQRDYSVIMVIAFFIAISILFASFIAEVLTAILDPRVRIEK